MRSSPTPASSMYRRRMSWLSIYNNGSPKVPLSQRSHKISRRRATTSFILIPFRQKWPGHAYIQTNQNVISVSHTKTDPPTLPNLASLMSTSPIPSTSPIHNSPSNANVNPTTALITLIQQTLQENATMMSHMHARPSPLPPPQPLTALVPDNLELKLSVPEHIVPKILEL